MADISGLAKLFEKADQVSLGLTLDNGQGAVVTLRSAERRLVARACRAAAEAAKETVKS